MKLIAFQDWLLVSFGVKAMARLVKRFFFSRLMSISDQQSVCHTRRRYHLNGIRELALSIN